MIFSRSEEVDDECLNATKTKLLSGEVTIYLNVSMTSESNFSTKQHPTTDATGRISPDILHFL